MSGSLTHKIIADHLVSGEMKPGTRRDAPLREGAPERTADEIAIRIDQTLTQDVTGTMAFLQFEAIGVPRVRTELSVSYVDHNMLQTGFESADDHRYLKSAAARFGVYFSRPGNGICHQVHLERFAVPGKTLLGSDSHTPTCGGLGMLAIGAGGLDVAAAMGGYPLYLAMPQVTLVRLIGKLPPWVSAKDIILEVLRRLTVKGGVGRIMEYGGKGVATLTVPERATIANMGAELGATSSIFPSDKQTLAFLRSQQREEAWRELAADGDAEYDDVVELDLDRLEPLVAQPHSPDNVAPAARLSHVRVDQVAIGSCTNSSFKDFMTVAAILDGKHVHPNVSLVISPGSRQVMQMLAGNGALARLIAAGARILEASCGPCIGMGQAPPSGGVTVRSFNRNFAGRTGTRDAQAYLASPQVCAASAIAGHIVDPRKLGDPPSIRLPARFLVDDSMIIPPAPDPEAAVGRGGREASGAERRAVEIVRGPNIAALPTRGPLEDIIRGQVLLTVPDNVTTDDIMPAGAEILPLRSNIPAISRYVFYRLDPEFATRARKAGGGFVAAGANYGQGSSREHAALAPMALGVRAVFARSFARIHHANLVNFGILPLKLPGDVRLEQDDELAMGDVRARIAAHQPLEVINHSRGDSFQASYDLSGRQARILLAGGLLNYIKEGGL
jgi:aconitate hydratase